MGYSHIYLIRKISKTIILSGIINLKYLLIFII